MELMDKMSLSIWIFLIESLYNIFIHNFYNSKDNKECFKGGVLNKIDFLSFISYNNVVLSSKTSPEFCFDSVMRV